jgi:hypothetical protein
MKLLIMQFSPVPCYFMPLGSKYSPQHPVLTYPQPVLNHKLQLQVVVKQKTKKKNSNCKHWRNIFNRIAITIYIRLLPTALAFS